MCNPTKIKLKKHTAQRTTTTHAQPKFLCHCKHNNPNPILIICPQKTSAIITTSSTCWSICFLHCIWYKLHRPSNLHRRRQTLGPPAFLLATSRTTAITTVRWHFVIIIYPSLVVNDALHHSSLLAVRLRYSNNKKDD